MIDSGWTDVRLRDLVTLNDSVLPESTEPSVEFDYVEIGDVQADRGIIGSSQTVFGEAPSRARRIVAPGDVLVSTVRTYLRAVALVDRPLVASTGFAALRARDCTDSRFLHYVCVSKHFADWTIAHSVGVSYPAINAADLVRYRLRVPPVAGQGAIADFLDHETATLDALIAKQEQLIATLQEDRIATMTHALTKGIDPAVEKKASGQAWCDDIPRHWQMASVKRVVRSVGVGLVINPSTYVADSGVPFLLGRNVRDGWIDLTNVNLMSEEDSRRLPASRLRTGDVVVVRAGYPGRAAVVPAELDGANCASILILRRPTLVLPEFLALFFNSRLGRAQVNLAQYGAAQEQVNVGDVVNFLLPVPPLLEQREILDRTYAKVSSIEALIAKALTMNDILREYRSALITDAVTGKIDVREMV